MKTRNVLFACVLCSLVPAGASALMREVPLEATATEAAAIVEGTVIDRISAWTDDGATIVTDAVVRVDGTLKGSEAPGTLVTVRAEGGEVGDTGIWVEHQPVLRRRERVVLFLRPAPSPASVRRVLHLEQGTFRIEDGRAIDYRGRAADLGVFKARVRSLVSHGPR